MTLVMTFEWSACVKSAKRCKVLKDSSIQSICETSASDKCALDGSGVYLLYENDTKLMYGAYTRGEAYCGRC